MLAKLGIGSPFNKRKIKELQENNQLLQQQQQYDKQQAQFFSVNQHYASNIPTPKKNLFTRSVPAHSGNLNSNATCSHNENNTDLNERINSNLSINVSQLQVHARHKSINIQNNMYTILSNESSSGINGDNDCKTISISSECASPARSTSELSYNGQGDFSLSNTTANKGHSKLPQLTQMISINKEKRKSSLPQSQVMQTQSKTQNKIQSPNSINLNSMNVNNQENQNSASKTVKRSGTLIKTSNNQVNTPTNSETQMQMTVPPTVPSNSSCSVVDSQINSTMKNINTSQLKQPSNCTINSTSNPKKISTFGLPKLTKLNTSAVSSSSSNNSQLSNSPLNTNQNETQNKQQQITKSINQTQTTSCSKIPSTFPNSKSQLKSPSIQISSNIKQPSIINNSNKSTACLSSTISTTINDNTSVNNANNIPTASSTQNKSLPAPTLRNKLTGTNLTSNISKLKQPSNTSSVSSVVSLSTFQSTNIARMSPLIQNKTASQTKINNRIIKTDELNNDAEKIQENNNTYSSGLIVQHKVTPIHSKEVIEPLKNSIHISLENADDYDQKKASINNDDEDELILGINENDECFANLIDENDEEFKNFLNEPIDDEGETSMLTEQSKESSKKDCVIFKEKKDNFNDITNKLMDYAFSEKFRKNEEQANETLNNANFSKSKKSPNLPSPPSSLVATSSSSSSSNLVNSPFPNNNIQTQIERDSNSSYLNNANCNNNNTFVLKSNIYDTENIIASTKVNSITPITTSGLNLNSFGRSNTLDRKLKPLHLTNSRNLTLTKTGHLFGNQNKNLNDNFLLTNLNSKNDIVYQQRNSLNLQLQQQNSLPKRPLSQEPGDSHNGFLSLSSNDLIKSINTLNQHNFLQQQKHHVGNEFDSTNNTCNRIIALTNQLNTNAQIIFTLEQSISTLNFKLQSLNNNSIQKDNVISELKIYIDYIHNKYPKILETEKNSLPNSLQVINRHNSTDSLTSLNSMFSHKSYQSNFTTFTTNTKSSELNNHNSSTFDPNKSKKRSWLRSSFNKAFNRKQNQNNKQKMNETSDVLHNILSTEKLCLSDVEENVSLKNQLNATLNTQQKYSEYEEILHYNKTPLLNYHNGFGGDFSLPNSPLHQIYHCKKQFNNANSNSKSNQNANFNLTVMANEEIETILRDKERKLTDIRLEQMATAQQLDLTKEENLKMKAEIEQLKTENIIMQQFLNQQKQIQSHGMVLPCPLISSPSPSSISSNSNNSKINLSLSNSIQNVDFVANNSSSSSSSSASSVSCSMLTNTLKLNNNQFSNEKFKSPQSECSNKIILNEPNINDGKRVVVSIYVGDLNPLDDLIDSNINSHILIGSININTKTNWESLDSMVKRLFKEYLIKLEENTSESGGLGLGLDSISLYYVGDMPRISFSDKSNQEQKVPDFLPYGYLVAGHTSIIIKLKDAPENSIDFLCYNTLVPKNVMQRYISLILDNKNLLFCGPSGTSKSFIARKIAEYLIKRQNKAAETSIAYFNVENKTAQDLKLYLNNITEHSNLCSTDEFPCVLILDNLQNISNISEAFMEYFSQKNSSNTKCAYIIGTINQSNVASLNLHQNFKWVLCLNHTEPVKNYLTRYSNRRLIDHETKYQVNISELELVSNWIPKLWQHVNKYIEMYNSIDLVIGPKLFSTFPLDMVQAQYWFIELWNNMLIPFLIESIKEGLEAHGTFVNENPWENPKLWLKSTLPWILYDTNILDGLNSIEAYDVGLQQDENPKEQSGIKNEESSHKNGNSNIKKPKNLEFQTMSYPNTPAKTLNRNSNENDKLLSMLMKLQETTLSTQKISNNISLLNNCSKNCFNSIYVNNDDISNELKNLNLIKIQKSVESTL